jgi:Lyzozyme M1 (1,4-beta-N-acetylmuramidase)
MGNDLGHNRIQIVAIFAAAIMLVFVSIIFFRTMRYGTQDGDGNSTSEAFTADGDRIIDNENYDKYNVAQYDVPLNQYVKDKFVQADGRISYENTLAGIDVSDYQKDIKWKRVKEDGIDFAIIRVGFRGYTKGGISPDGRFVQNIKGAMENDIQVGVYFFSQAITEEEAEKEAKYVLEKVKPYDITFPIFFDWEPITHYPEGQTPRTANMQPHEISKVTKAFCDEIAKQGYTAGYYTNKSMGYDTYDLDLLADYDVWYAEYQNFPSFYFHFDMWQYSESATIKGIEGPVDMNISFKTYEKAQETSEDNEMSELSDKTEESSDVSSKTNSG